MNILYNYYCNKLQNKGNDSENIIIEKLDIPNNFHESMKKLIKINLNKFFYNYYNIKEDLLNRNDSRKVIVRKTTFLVEFIFRYFDLCLLLLYKENIDYFFEYMIKPEYNSIKFYKDYKILTLDKYKENKDYEEKVAFIYYLIELASSNIVENKETKDNKVNSEIYINNINEYKFKQKSDLYDVTFEKGENENNEINNYNKIIILSFDDKTKKYYYQDIIDFNTNLIYDNKYKLRVNKNIHLVPLKNIDTYLYSIENEPILLNEAKNSNDNIPNKITKYENIPKYSWNFGYDGNKYLLLSEEDNQVYSFYNQQNYYESMKGIFKIDIR
jgi:hypothetical protein